MSTAENSSAGVPCARCSRTFGAELLTMTDRGEWICRPCHAEAQAVATTRLHQDVEEKAQRWPYWVAGGILFLIVLGILKVFLMIGEGFGRAL